jgi:HSP20 family protein
MSRFLDAVPAPRDVPGAGVFPAVNLTQDSESFYVRAELPGMKAKDLDVSAFQRTLTIAGERKVADEQGASYHRRERAHGPFSRSVTLPGDFDSEKVQARFVNGVLTVTLPKPDAAKPRQISVKSA